jgi:hypothetical protein
LYISFDVVPASNDLLGEGESSREHS